MILNVDPLLEPSNGPNWFPFDPDVLYEIKIDNDHDGVEDRVFQFRFESRYTAPGFYQVYAGTPGGAVAPSNSPPPAANRRRLRRSARPPRLWIRRRTPRRSARRSRSRRLSRRRAAHPRAP
jgi:hypothetical protein